MRCGQCGASLGAADRFCGTCGAPLGACPSCGEQVVPGDRFCRACGFELSNGQAARKAAAPDAEPAPGPLVPAVPVRRSVQPEYVVCLECGFRGKTLRRHLRMHHGLEVGAYVPAGSCHPITRRQHQPIRSAALRWLKSSDSGVSRARSSHHLPPGGEGGRASQSLSSGPWVFPMPADTKHSSPFGRGTGFRIPPLPVTGRWSPQRREQPFVELGTIGLLTVSVRSRRAVLASGEAHSRP